jgi:hypothetical protein
MFGPVVSLDEVGALYRLHGKNNYGSMHLTDLTVLRKDLMTTEYGRTKQRDLFKTLYSADVREVGPWDLTFLRNRMISLKLDPLNHTCKDSTSSLCIRGCISSVIYPEMRWYERLVYVLWFSVMLFAPKTLAESWTERLFNPEKRGRWIKELLAIMRRR